MEKKVFVDDMGRERKGAHAIFPMCKQYPNKNFEIIGTGFGYVK